MKFKGTWLLALIAGLLGAYIYFIEIKKTAKDEEAKTSSEKIFQLEADKVNKIELLNTFGKIILEKDKSDWFIREPVKDSADSPTVSSLVSSLTSEKFDQVVTEGGDVDPKVYGLDQPKVTVELSTSDGKKQKVNVGIDAALPGKVYVRKEGEKRVLFATSNVKSQGDKGLRDLREKKIFRKSKDDVAVIELSYHRKENSAKVILEKADKDWVVAKPFFDKADHDTIQSLLSQLEGFRATDFSSEEGEKKEVQKKFDLSHPDVEIVLKDKDKKEIESIVISPKKENNAYVKTSASPTIYQIFMSSVEQFVHKPDDFRDKKSPFEFKKDEVNQIHLKTELFENDLIKKGENWELSLPNKDKQVNQIQVSNLLDKLVNLRVSEFVKEPAKGLSPPKGQVVLKDSKGEMLLDFDWGAKTKDGRNYFAKTNKAKTALGVDAAAVDSFPAQTLVESKAKLPDPLAQPTQPPTGH